MTKKLKLILITLFAFAGVNAQNQASETKGEFKVSGYVQGQFQAGEKAASLKVGTSNEDVEKSFNRIGIRSGYLKLVYKHDIVTTVFQFNATEKGVGIKDAYINIEDPWIKSMALKVGLFNRPFGHEIGYSSTKRESPERSVVVQTLFPEERDLGGMLILQAPKGSGWESLKLEAGLFAGNGIKQETDSRKDFIGHLSYSKKLKNFSLGAGVSYYNGGVWQGSSDVYRMDGNGFILDNNENNKGKFAKREYYGLDAQLQLKSPIGSTLLNAEYLWGQQPATENSSKSPNASTLPTSDTYIRLFNGGYVMLAQYIAKTPIAVVVKYDWYDPNKDVSGNSIGTNSTGKADIAVNTLGFGGIWEMNTNLRLQAYYEVNNNEKSSNLSGYGSNRKDNVFTLRLQYKF
ncbi:MAG: OprO/OprP family phosphate-selective porin [Culturomica sp.]|jgi:phosphate-selective porin|nr:OprO/OprP family phosphate-selective porin [Culturomica sp.]